MIQGVTSLRCPACGQPFLTLPQAAEAQVTCPHCARSARMAAYPPAGQQQDAGGAEALPVRRREAGPRPAGAGGLFTPVRQAPGSPQTRPAWPAAPEQQRPQGPRLPPQVSPFGISPPQSVPPAGTWPGPPQNVEQTVPMTAFFQPRAEPPPEPVPPPPPGWLPTASVETQAGGWPGPGVEQTPFSQTPFSQVPFEPVPRPLPPPAERKRAPVVAAVLLLLVSWGAAWLAWVESRPVWARDFPLPEPPRSAETPESEKALAKLSQAPPAAPAEPEPEVRRAQVPDAVENPALSPTPELLEQAESLLRNLLDAPDQGSRLALLAAPEEHEVEVAEFFAHGAPELRSLAYANATPRSLPGGAPVPLFQVMTDRCPGGALLRLVPQADGTLRLEWPLFAETHERRLAQYLEKKPEEPGWFHAGMRRSHGLDLPAAVREGHLAYDLQGSADGSVRCLAVAARETPLGRFLEREAGWGGVHLARLLLQHREDAEAGMVLHILDCEGARTGASRAGSGGQ